LKQCIIVIFFLYLQVINLQLKAQEVPFTNGINLTNWFQAGSPQQIQVSKYSLEDFEHIQSLGCDVIRLPINLHAMTDGAPSYTLDPLFLDFLDQAADWAEILGIYLILDNHTFDPAESTDPNIGVVLEAVWTQMAEHFKDRSEYIIYEVLNEPHGISDELWNSIQLEVVDAIRAVDQEHYVVIGPAGWNSFHNLAAMPVYPQDKLIYTFHFYDPFIFTHQGATWTSPSMGPLADVPFPYQASEMPSFPAELAGTWIQSAFNDYQNTGTLSNLRSMMDIAVAFGEARNVPIYCGEFGTYIPNSPNDDRVYYYQQLREYLEEKDIAWTMWDYHGGFGLYEEGGSGLFDHDLNIPLVEALGMNAPAQTPFVITPEVQGFPVYTDQIEDQILEASSGGSSINYYSQDSPNNGEYCLRWTQAPRYQYVGLNMTPNKDLNQLVDQEYALDFLIRGSQPFQFDIRFMDTDTGDDDRPWRMRYTIDEDVVPFDGRWHHLHIPLADFSEGGAWEGQYYPPEGKFDWTAIDELQIIAEYQDMGNTKVWFDNLIVTNLDTAQVLETSVFEDLVTSTNDPINTNELSIFPNPAQQQVTIRTASDQTETPYHYQLINILGDVLIESEFTGSASVDISRLPAAVYLIKVRHASGKQQTLRLLK
jgi:endoglucanase